MCSHSSKALRKLGSQTVYLLAFAMALFPVPAPRSRSLHSPLHEMCLLLATALFLRFRVTAIDSVLADNAFIV